MSSISKSAKSRRKKQRAGDRKVALDFIDVQFLHEMVGGEAGFNLAELTLPGGSGSFLNPSPAVVASAANNMRTKLRLFNESGKRMALGVEYEVVGTQVNFINITAGVGAIFFGDIANVPRTGADFLDGEVKSATGFLIPGETLFNIGFNYRIGDKVSAANRKGPLQVERNRLTQYVNTIFETAGPAQDGDYAHRRAGVTAFGTMIEFNSPGTILPSGLPEFISVETRQIIVDRNSLSLRNELESQQGSLLAMAQELGIIQSLDPNLFFQAKPSVVQTKQFGDILLGLLDIQVPKITALQAYTPVFGSVGTATEIECSFRQVGGNFEIFIRYRWGTVIASPPTISLPLGGVVTNLMPLGVTSVFFNVGSSTSNNNHDGHYTVLAKAGNPHVSIAISSSTLPGLLERNANAFGGAGGSNSRHGFFASVPIEGLFATQTLREHLEAKGIL